MFQQLSATPFVILHDIVKGRVNGAAACLLTVWHIIFNGEKLKRIILYSYPEAGAFYEGNGATRFTVWAPLRRKMELMITAPDPHRVAMEKDDRGYWNATVQGTPGLRYLFRLDGEAERPDPASVSQPEGVHGPSEVTDRHAYTWTDTEWKGRAPGELVIYELHTGAFTGQGNFDGVASRLDYLEKLGVNAIEIMPVGQFPGSRNWGYDGVYPFAVQNSYGGMNGLKRLVDAAHHRGIAVILDVIYNHLGPEGNYLGDYGPYFTDKYHTPWGRALNFDDAWCDGVRQYFWQNALMWLDEFHIDGLRLDAVHAIWDFSARHFMEELQEQVKMLEKRCGRRKFLIAEFDLNNPRYIDPPEKGGYGMDAQWIDEFHHALHVVLTGEKSGYYEDFDGMASLAKSFRDSYVYTGQYSPHRKKRFGVCPRENPYDQFIVFAQNHDQVGNRLEGDRLTARLSPEALKLAAATVLLSPHVPLLFMGEEYGEKNPFLYFTSHSDENLIKALREGRRKEFASFNWQGEVPDPQSEDVFRRSALSWKVEGDAQAAALFDFYRRLIAFRKTRTAMQCRDRGATTVYPVEGTVGMLAFERECREDKLLILLNFSTQQQQFRHQQPYAIRKVLDSSEADRKGGGSELPAETAPGDNIPLNPLSAVIFEKI